MCLLSGLDCVFSKKDFENLPAGGPSHRSPITLNQKLLGIAATSATRERVKARGAGTLGASHSQTWTRPGVPLLSSHLPFHSPSSARRKYRVPSRRPQVLGRKYLAAFDVHSRRLHTRSNRAHVARLCIKNQTVVFAAVRAIRQCPRSQW